MKYSAVVVTVDSLGENDSSDSSKNTFTTRSKVGCTVNHAVLPPGGSNVLMIDKSLRMIHGMTLQASVSKLCCITDCTVARLFGREKTDGYGRLVASVNN